MLLLNILLSIKKPNSTPNLILANYIKDNLGLISARVLAFKPSYCKKLYLLGTILINIIGNNCNNSVVIRRRLEVKG